MPPKASGSASFSLVLGRSVCAAPESPERVKVVPLRPAPELARGRLRAPRREAVEMRGSLIDDPLLNA
jgi:hypothetical protein